MKQLLFITGRPGVGKTSVLLRVVEELKTRAYKVGGMISREARVEGRRIGFEIMDLRSGRKGWLAHVDQPVGPKIGKYRVNLRDLDTIGAGSIRSAAENAQVVIIDEVGPMELRSQTFREAMIEALDSGKAVLGTVHFKARDPIIDTIRNRDDAEVIEVTHRNRAYIHNILVDKVVLLPKE